MTSTSRKTTPPPVRGVWCIRRNFAFIDAMRTRGLSSYRHVVKRYADLAPSYDTRWRAYLGRTIGHAVEALNLSGTERVLDVGCGTGAFERMAVGRFPHLAIVGIDLTPAMVAVARIKSATCPQASFLVAKAEALPFDTEQFDAVIVVNVLHHVQDPHRAVQECLRVLRPHGRVIVVDWCRDFWHCRVMHYWLTWTDHGYVRMYRLAELAALIEHEARAAEVEEARRFIVPPLYGILRVVARKEASGIVRVHDACHRRSLAG